MDRRLRDVVLAEIDASSKKMVKVETLLTSVRRENTGIMSDFEIQDRLLGILRALDSEKRIRLPASKQAMLGLADRLASFRHSNTARGRRQKKKTKREN